MREIARRGDYHVVWRVPVTKPIVERLAIKSFDALGGAQDRTPQWMVPPEVFRKYFMDPIFRIVLDHADLFQHHRSFAADFFLGKLRIEHHVRQYVKDGFEMLVEDSRVETDHFLGGECVNHSARAVHFARDIFGLATRSALEHHVFNEMRNAVQFGRLASRTAANPNAHRDRAHMLHRLGDRHEPVGQRRFFNFAISSSYATPILTRTKIKSYLHRK